MRQAGALSSLALTATMLAHVAALAATPPVPPAAAASGLATTLSDACPTQLPVTQTISETIAGWTPLNQQGSHAFVRVAFYPGPPAETSLIVPTFEFQGASGLHDGWSLPPRAGGYWMACTYANTTASVARQLPAGVDFCQADYDRRFQMLVVRRWSCGLRRTMLPSAARPAGRAASRPPNRHGA
jgi:hypothetical protein